MTGVPIRVLVVDDDDGLMRAGLRAILSVDDGIAVVGEAADGRAAVTRTYALDPDVVLMDIRMPDVDGSRRPVTCWRPRRRSRSSS